MTHLSHLPWLQPRLLLGLRTDLPGNALFVTDEDILYPVGAVLTVHNINQNKQKYIKLADRGKNVNGVFISPNKKLICVIECGEKPFATLWCPVTFKKKRVITLPTDKEIDAERFTCGAFSHDSKNLFLVTGENDWTMYCFKCDKGRLDSTTKANNSNNTGYVRQVVANPNDANTVCLIGDNLIRILACTDFVWRQFGYSKGDQWSFSSACWISQERILLGTVNGKILVLENGDLKSVISANDFPVLNLKFKDEDKKPPVPKLQQTSKTSLPEVPASTTEILSEGADIKIRSLIFFQRGFAFGYLTGTVHLYEMETPLKYIKRNVFKIPDHQVVREYEEYTGPLLTEINCISIDPSQSKLMVSCNETQLYSVTLWMQDMVASPELMFHEYGFNLHNGPIGSMSVCAWKPLILTSGENDRTLKIWNYETEELEMTQQFQDDIFAIALHPTGLFAIAGFSDKLRFLTIMIDEFVVTREFSIRFCKKCTFSHLGQYFAASNGNVIQIYSSINFDMLYNLKGHSGIITGMSWTIDDVRMASCGEEGSVYEWVVSESKRNQETILKYCNFRGAAITTEGKSIYVVSSDGHIRELVNSNVHRDVLVTTEGLDEICLSHINTMLFVTGNNGVVYVVKLPLLEKAESVEYIMHSSSVTHMYISFDDRFLFTGSRDGNICVWKLLNIEGQAIKMDKDFAISKDILISRSILEDKLSQIRNLQLRLRELETEYAYQLRQNDAIHSLKMKDIHAGYCNAIGELKEKNEQMEAEHVQEIHNINMEIKNMKQQHEEFVRELEANYNEKLIFEYEKYMRLEEKMDRMRRYFEKELEDLHKAKKDSEESITNNFLEKLQEKDEQFDELTEQTARKTKAHEIIKLQIEEDADREIYELRQVHAKELREEQELNVKIRGETSMVKKKLLATQKEIDDLKHTVYMLENEHSKFKKTIINLEREIADLKKEIAERDATVLDKEKRIYELKRKNQELEKFKFILEFKIKELKSQIEPRERTIQEQKEQMAEMVRELENLQKVILSLDLQLRELRDKLKASNNEVAKEIAKNATMKRALKNIKTDIYEASGFIQDVPMLIKCVKDMYHRFNIDEDFALGQAEDTEVKTEFMRQREFLERTIGTLQNQAQKGTSTMSRDKLKLIDENAILIQETNSLRKSLKDQLSEAAKLHSVLGIHTKTMPPRVAAEKVKNATATREEIKDEYRSKIRENETQINLLKEENNRLLTAILGDESSDEFMD